MYEGIEEPIGPFLQLGLGLWCWFFFHLFILHRCIFFFVRNRLRYVEQELAKKRGRNISANHAENEIKHAEDELYNIPEHLKVSKAILLQISYAFLKWLAIFSWTCKLWQPEFFHCHINNNSPNVTSLQNKYTLLPSITKNYTTMIVLQIISKILKPPNTSTRVPTCLLCTWKINKAVEYDKPISLINLLNFLLTIYDQVFYKAKRLLTKGRSVSHFMMSKLTLYTSNTSRDILLKIKINLFLFFIYTWQEQKSYGYTKLFS